LGRRLPEETLEAAFSSNLAVQGDVPDEDDDAEGRHVLSQEAFDFINLGFPTEDEIESILRDLEEDEVAPLGSFSTGKIALQTSEFSAEDEDFDVTQPEAESLWSPSGINEHLQ
jgi:hypothetical protein